MKLLFDQNLSPRLGRLLADIYPDSIHVREVGLRDSDDAAIWDTPRRMVSRLSQRIQISSSVVCCTALRLSSFGFALATAL
jgi:predicted nuclease of predicted toxin-antitoxin system